MNGQQLDVLQRRENYGIDSLINELHEIEGVNASYKNKPGFRFLEVVIDKNQPQATDGQVVLLVMYGYRKYYYVPFDDYDQALLDSDGNRIYRFAQFSILAFKS